MGHCGPVHLWHPVAGHLDVVHLAAAFMLFDESELESFELESSVPPLVDAELLKNGQPEFWRYGQFLASSIVMFFINGHCVIGHLEFVKNGHLELSSLLLMFVYYWIIYLLKQNKHIY
jgi:hypothetical protein